MVKILMVCLGNICRSPLAEGILKSELERRGIAFEIDSAGTSDWHHGERPDTRAVQTAKNHNVDISGQRSRPLSKNDFEYYDLIFAMDQNNFNDIIKLGGESYLSKIHLLLEFAGYTGTPVVPDPYYGDLNGFEQVYELLASNCSGICDRLEKNIKP